MNKKRKNGLCYRCNEQWNPSHIYKSSKVYLLQVKDCGNEHVEQEESIGIVQEGALLEHNCGSEDLQISVNAIHVFQAIML